MSYITQGTVQVECNGSKIVFLINPTSDYTVTHGEKGYIASVKSGPTVRAFEMTTPFEVTDDHIRSILMGAAGNGTRVELRIHDTKEKIVAVKMPATRKP